MNEKDHLIRMFLTSEKHKFTKKGQTVFEKRKEMWDMTKKFNKGSRNQNSPQLHGQAPVSGDNSKGNKRNKDQSSKTE